VGRKKQSLLHAAQKPIKIKVSMIEAKSMFEDLRTDAVGQAINELRAKHRWDKAKYSLRDHLFEELKRQNYTKAVGTRAQFCMTGGIGFSYLYLVPSQQRGLFKSYSGKLLRLVYYASARDYLEIRFSEVEQDQKGRPFSDFGEGDPRRYFHQVCGEVTSRGLD
jgi:hypothetical protein